MDEEIKKHISVSITPAPRKTTGLTAGEMLDALKNGAELIHHVNGKIVTWSLIQVEREWFDYPPKDGYTIRYPETPLVTTEEKLREAINWYLETNGVKINDVIAKLRSAE